MSLVLADALKEVQISDKDTGSSQVQALRLTSRILGLAEHIKKNHKDNSAKRRLSCLVGQRKRHVAYLKKHDVVMFEKVLKMIKS